MNCTHPQCKGHMTVRNTVHVDAHTIRRQRVCQVCGRSIATVEQPYLGPPLRKGNRLITYTLPEEGGTSLRAAGWRLLGEAGGGSWGRASRPRVDTAPTQRKLCWEAS